MPGENAPLLVGSKNPDKVLEIRRFLAGLPVRVTDLSAFDVPDVAEDGDTFEANAAAKARGFAAETGLLTVADDSGLEIDALGGAPGVYSARFAGEPPDDEANNALVLERLAGVPDDKRTARFRCVIALASPEGLIFTTEGRARRLRAHLRGTRARDKGLDLPPRPRPCGIPGEVHRIHAPRRPITFTPRRATNADSRGFKTTPCNWDEFL